MERKPELSTSAQPEPVYQSQPPDFTYHPDMRRDEVVKILEEERKRFFKDWGNV